jgi:hypothetical protein
LFKKESYINWFGIVQCLVAKCKTKIKRSDLWHQKLGHVYIQTYLFPWLLNLVESMDLNGNHDLNFYGGCVYGKHHHTPFPSNGGSYVKNILKLMHINLCDPIATSHGRTKYFLTFINDFFRKTFFYTIKINLVCLTILRSFKLWYRIRLERISRQSHVMEVGNITLTISIHSTRRMTLWSR